jgi:hypothetical protein
VAVVVQQQQQQQAQQWTAQHISKTSGVYYIRPGVGSTPGFLKKSRV